MLSVLQSLNTGAILLLAFLVFTHPKGANRTANRWLGFFLFCVFSMMLDDLFLNEALYERFPHLLGLDVLATFLMPPTFFMSVSYFVEPNRIWRRKDWLHFSLFFLLLLLSLSFFFQDGATKLTAEDEPASRINLILTALLDLAFLFHVFLYWWLAFRKLLRHRRNIHLYAASEEDTQLNWLRYFAFVYLFMLSVWIASVFTEINWLYKSSYIVYFFGVFLLACYAVRQGEVFPYSEQEKKAIGDLIEVVDNISNSSRPLLSAAALEQMKVQLLQFMEKERPHLDNNLNLPKLAAGLELSTHQLSYLLNQGFQENFFRFINRYRVEEAQRILEDPRRQHLNMLEVAFEAGFNSKTVFNTHFKALTGQPPSAYRRTAKD